MVKKEICRATKKDGSPCKNKAKDGTRYCGVHKNYYLFSDADVKVYYPSGKSIEVKYKKDIEEFKKQLDEYKTNIIKIFIKGEEDEPKELPQHIESVFCLLENPRYLKVGFVAYQERDEWTKFKRIITKIYKPNPYRTSVDFSTYIIRDCKEEGIINSNIQKNTTITINELHTEFYHITGLTPLDFNEPESESE